MTRFLFWNLNRRDLHGFVACLARQENADVVILAESRAAGAAARVGTIRIRLEVPGTVSSNGDAPFYARH
jgi:hypothetical protein